MVENAVATSAVSGRKLTRISCSKAIIVGEHAVVYGAQAVAMPLKSLITELILTPRKQLGYRFKTGFGPLNRQRLRHLKEVVLDAFRVLQISPFPFEINFKSNSLMGAGLGSSAALSVALIRLLGSRAGRRMTDSQVARLANYLERRFHGNPSGLDTAVVACGTPILFHKDSPPQKIKPALLTEGYPWRFALIDSGVRSSTLAMIKKALPYFQGDKACLQKFSDYARLVARSLAQGKILPVADAMNRVDAVLRDAGVTTAHLVAIIDEVKSLGVLAAKSTGAGGGGCVLSLLCPAQADKQLQTMQKIYGSHNVYEVVL